MGHSIELLDACKERLLDEYPETRYSYVYEQVFQKGTRMFPDVLVYLAEKLVCVVEIGYTRPEKLQKYIDVGVPDVRWYSKQMHLFFKHTNIDQKFKEATECRVSDVVESLVSENLQEIERAVGFPPYFVCFGDACADCDVEGVREHEANMFIRFDESRYSYSFECEINGDHDMRDSGMWKDSRDDLQMVGRDFDWCMDVLKSSIAAELLARRKFGPPPSGS